MKKPPKLRAVAPRVPVLRQRVPSVSTSSERITGRARQRIRRALLEEQPLCSGPDSVCEREGRVTLATEIDHPVALINGGTDSDGNRQALCHECHRLKTQRDMAIARGWE